MNIIVTSKNKEKKIISVFDLEKEISKVISIKQVNIDETIVKLKRGDLLGFNDVHFKME